MKNLPKRSSNLNERMQKIVPLARLKAQFIVFFLTFFLALSSTAAQSRTVVDSRGQAIEIPEKVERVAPLIPAFAQMTEMLTLGSGKIVAYPTSVISQYFKKVFPDIVASNPANYDTGAIEDIIASGAQVVFGPDSRLSEEQRAQLAKANVAMVAINDIATVDAICRSFLLIGEILGPEETKRAQLFATYYQDNENLARKLSASIPESEKQKVLVLSGQGGRFSTITTKDIGHEHLTAAGGLNVAADYMSGLQGMSMTIDPEQIISWDPDFILAYSFSARDDIINNSIFSDLKAVKNNRVVTCPQGIFLWAVRSGEGALMALWLGTQLYPEEFKSIDVRAMVRDFFKNFYNYDLPPDELEKILLGQTRDI
ncbi:MAG: ABC transporter substrate-binding protein [Deltaproteobacteria bacterium]|jgi:iron complex transport system substrate-binding protein|nr:ABC transporter substrate-binding protein [Deltaproteobacteria bacterium]